jgi:hypothetical protein
MTIQNNQKARKKPRPTKPTMISVAKDIVKQGCFTTGIPQNKLPEVSAIAELVVGAIVGHHAEKLPIPEGATDAVRTLVNNVNEWSAGGSTVQEQKASKEHYRLHVSQQEGSRCCATHAQCITNSWVAALNDPDLVGFSIGLDAGKNPLVQHDKPVAYVVRMVHRRHGQLVVTTGLVHLENAGVLGRGRHHAYRIKTLLARLCGHDGASCDCDVPTDKAFEARVSERSHDQTDERSSAKSDTPGNDSDTLYWAGHQDEEREADDGNADHDQHSKYRFRKDSYNVLKQVWAEAKACPAHKANGLCGAPTTF